jgi:hypothetical protein
MRSSGASPATACTSARTCAGWPTPIVSPSEISVAPSASSFAVSDTTAPIATSPSYGQPHTVET